MLVSYIAMQFAPRQLQPWLIRLNVSDDKSITLIVNSLTRYNSSQ